MADDTLPAELPKLLKPEIFRKAVQNTRLQKRVMAYAYTDLLMRCRDMCDRKTELGVLNAIRDTFLTSTVPKTNDSRLNDINKLIQQHPLARKEHTDGTPSTH